MLNKGEIKRLFRSGSLRFVLDSRTSAAGRPIAQYMWRGVPIHYRPGTSDPGLIYSILLKGGRKGEYWVPEALDPKVILDIGGNIGISSRYFAARFPRTRIYAFEPVPDNVQLLQRNTERCANVRVVPVALGRMNGKVSIMSSDDAKNLGGFSFHHRGSDPTATREVDVRDINDPLRELGVEQIDLIKIDTEGSEYDILTALDPSMLRSVKWIMGELHGERDFELLAYLSKWFDIDTKKSLKNRLFMFRACNKSLTRQLRLG